MEKDSTTFSSNETQFGNDINSLVPKKAVNVASTAQSFAKTGGLLANNTLNMVKLALSPVGIVKTLIHGVALSDDINIDTSSPMKIGAVSAILAIKREENQYTGTNINRADTSQECVFQIGDYFLPLSYNVTVSGQKRIEQTPLVDGVTVIERISKQPRVVNIAFEIKPKGMGNSPDSLFSLENNMSGGTISLEGTQQSINAKSIEKKYLQQIRTFFDSLYSSDTIFRVENPIVNETFGVDYVVLTAYSITPIVGSFNWNVTLSLVEVDTTHNLLYVENDTYKGVSAE